MHRVGHAERGPRMATRSRIRNAKTPRAECAVDDAFVARAVERDRGMRAAAAIAEVVFGATQIADAFFARCRDKFDRTPRTQTRAVDLPGERKHDGQPPSIVVDARAHEPITLAADRQIGLARKDSIEMRTDDDGLELVRA